MGFIVEIRKMQYSYLFNPFSGITFFTSSIASTNFKDIILHYDILTWSMTLLLHKITSDMKNKNKIL